MSTPAASPAITEAGRRRILGAFFVARGSIGVGYLAGFIVLTIAGKELSGHAELAGWPAAISMVGRAIGPPPIARAMEVFGRRPAIAGSYALGAVGAATAALAVAAGLFWLLLVGSLLMGVARAGGDMSRYVAAEIYEPSRRGRAIGIVVWGGTAGAIGGPLLGGYAQELAGAGGLSPLAGPWFAAAGLLLFSALVTWAFVRPDPRDVADPTPEAAPADGEPTDLRGVLRDRRVQLGILAILTGQGVMTLIMVVIPLHLDSYADLGEAVPVAMTAHVAGMFALAPLTGRLVDLLGPRPMVLIGSVLLMLASALAAFDAGVGTVLPAMFLLGYGWNACFVAGSTMLARGVPLNVRARIQGRVEVLIGVVGVFSSAASGSLLAFGSGMGWLGAAGLISALLLLVALGWERSATRAAAGA
ncbi:MAG: MFS transporter [Chloroflexota bacterium]|nr:MFS transporter [Chloroflexota bacterium]